MKVKMLSFYSIKIKIKIVYLIYYLVVVASLLKNTLENRFNKISYNKKF